MNILATSARPSQSSPFIDFTFPSHQPVTGTVSFETDKRTMDGSAAKVPIRHERQDAKADKFPRRQIIWKNVILMSGLHIITAYTLLRLRQFQLFTLVFGAICYNVSMLGVTAGVHRLWTHRAYKARLPLKIILMLWNSLALQNSIFDWCRDHRTHHKYSETDADPHNACRGFFFSHIGWLLVRKHPDVAKKGKSVPLDDLLKDPVVTFQRRYYVPMAITFCFVIPTLIPWYFGGETLWNAYCLAAFRYCITLHATWCVNSFAHMYGGKPYDKRIHPSENPLVTYFTLGEGFHNYHHTFPHDYAASEFGMKLNITTAFIDLMAIIGQAYDRRVVGRNIIQARKQRTGELSELNNTTW